ncbi:type IV pilin N-terminal domain-containing protein [Methanohalobium evestigatum]
MVAITVILAAVIGSFVFGMENPESAPQASIQGSAYSDSDGDDIVMISHQGGEEIDLHNNVRITMSGNDVNIGSDNVSKWFKAGDKLYIISNSSSYFLVNSTNLNAVNADSGIATDNNRPEVNIIDIPSQQPIANFNLRFQ